MEKHKDYKGRLRQAFEEYDHFLKKYTGNKFLYGLFLSLRTHYALYRHKPLAADFYQPGISERLKLVFKALLKLALLPVQTVILEGKGKVILYGNSEKDQYVAGQISATNAIYKLRKRMSARSLKATFQFYKVFHALVLMLFTVRLQNKYKGLLYNFIIDYGLHYFQTDLDGVSVVATENDTYCVQVALITKAKKANIPTVKLEYYIIDDIHHDNVWCEYYFYPSEYYKTIRKRSWLNEKLKYIEGGFINLDVMANYQQTAEIKKNKQITFFTQPGTINGEITEESYIKTILSHIDDSTLLTIKVHPRDTQERYVAFGNYENCHIVTSKEADNYLLVAKSDVCLSIFSGVILEAKHLCSRAYFVNYNAANSQNILDYQQYMPDVGLITNDEKLIEVITMKDNPVDTKTYTGRFNIKYPHSAEVFNEFVHKQLIRGNE